MFCLRPINQLVLACALFFGVSAGAMQFGLTSCTLTTIRDHFGVENLQMGIAIASYQVTQILGSPVGPILEAKTNMSMEFMCACAMLLNVCGALVYGLAQNYAMLIIGQLLNGCGGAAVNVMMPFMFAKLADDPAEISLAIAKTYVATPVGIVLASVGCGGAGPENWRVLFIGFGSMLIAPAILLLVIAHRYTTHPDPRKQTIEAPSLKLLLDVIFKNPSVMLSVAGITCSALVVAGMSAFLSAFYEEFVFDGWTFSDAPLSSNATTYNSTVSSFSSSWSTDCDEACETLKDDKKSLASYLVAATVPSVVIGTLIGGCISNRMGLTRKKLLGFCGVNVTAAFLSLFISLPAETNILTLVILAFVLGMFFLFMVAGPAVAVAVQLVPLHMVGYSQVVMNMISRTLGGIMGPILMGALIDSGEFSYPIAFFVISWFLFLSAIFYFLGWLVTPFDEEVGLPQGKEEDMQHETDRGVTENDRKANDAPCVSEGSAHPGATVVRVN